MTRLRSISALTAVFGVVLAVGLTGCGGGGGSSGTTTVPNSLTEIRVQGVTTPLWQNVSGTPTSPPVCPTGVFLNASITFTFNGAVSQASLPPLGGLAQGSVNISTTNGGTTSIAQGSFTVVDDPTLPAGNNRRVIFTPTLPASATNPCESGYTAGVGTPVVAGGATFSIFVPKAGNSTQIIVVDNQPLSTEAVTCFKTCPCPQPVPATECTAVSTDIAVGPPSVIATTPATADVPTGSVDPCALPGNQVVITVSEPISPANIDAQNVKLVNTLSGLQVPGTVTFTQGGSGGVPATRSRITYTASAPLLGSTIYEITFTNNIRDFGNNPIVTNATNPTQRLRFQTNPVSFVPGTPITESFNSPVNLGASTGAISWSSTGSVVATYPLEYVGNGSNGAFTPAAGTNTLDTNATQGIFNYTSVLINAGVTVRVTGDYLCHWRVLGDVTINGTVNLSAGTNPATAAVGTAEQGAAAGQFNNGGTTSPNIVRGGRGNAGGGDGGRGSQSGAIRTEAGEAGFGARVSGTANPGPAGSNAFYGGGAGGDAGFFPGAAGEFGGLGGAGGSAGTTGTAGSPRNTTPAYPNCTVNTTGIQAIAQATGIPPVFVSPISEQSAGSGGAGGGDHLDNALTAPQADDQGGGGGGGGGSLRISCVGNYAQGASGAGIITANGAVGGAGSTNAGSGGSGSGGQVWVQAFSSITVSSASTISVDGPLRLSTTGCAAGAAGDGGEGLIQFEAGVGTPSTTFTRSPGAVFTTAPFPFSAGVTGTVTSTFFDTTYGAPDFTSVAESKTQGNAAGATLLIAYEGAPESTATPGTPDVTLVKSTQGGQPITAATLDALDGYRFIRFKITITYPAPPATPASATLPSVQDITINYNIAPTCP